ncbi:hypothetical protein [Clostridium butyricum]
MRTNRELIRFLRNRYDISQDALARNVIGENGKPVTRNYINMIENNTGNVSLSESRAKEIINIIYKIGEKKKRENLRNKDL